MNRWTALVCGVSAALLAAGQMVSAETTPAVELEADRELAEQIRDELDAQERQEIETDLSPIHGELPAIAPEPSPEYENSDAFDPEPVEDSVDPDDLLMDSEQQDEVDPDAQDDDPDEVPGAPTVGESPAPADATGNADADTDEDDAADPDDEPEVPAVPEIDSRAPDDDIDTVDPSDLDIDRPAAAKGDDE